MQMTEIEGAMHEAKRFLNAAHVLVLQIHNAPDRISKENAACQRASLDLTRALTKMRQS